MRVNFDIRQLGRADPLSRLAETSAMVVSYGAIQAPDVGAECGRSATDCGKEMSQCGECGQGKSRRFVVT